MTLRSLDTATPEAQALAAIRAHIGQRLRREPESVDERQSFTALGLDSVRLLELGAELTARFGVELADFAAYDHPTPADLARHIARLVTAPSPPAATAREPPPHAEPTRIGMDLPHWPRKSGT